MATASLIADAESRMRKTLEALSKEMNTIRTGRASPGIAEGILVDYNGVPTPLNQLATITAPEARLLVIQPWDRSAIQAIEKGILKSSLGLNPSSDGTVVRIPIPHPTEERRRELVKVVRRHAEEYRVAMRNVRRDVLERLRAREREKQMSQDESKRYQDQLQKLTDAFVAQVDTLAAAKEAEVMEV